MKTKLFILAVLVALVSCAQDGKVHNGMTAGEEVMWMQNWLERDYGECPEYGYTQEQLDEHAEVVMEHVNAIMHAYEYPDEPADIVRYFRGVPDWMISDPYQFENEKVAENHVQQFWASLRMLQEYAEGKSEYYPASELLAFADSLLDRFQDSVSHGNGEYSYDYSYVLLAFRIIQQLVRLCPDIDLLATEHYADAGIIRFKGARYRPGVSVLLLKGNSSVYLPVMVECPIVRLEKSAAEDGVYHFYSEDYFEGVFRAFSLQKHAAGWDQWYWRDEEYSFLPGSAYYVPESLEEHMKRLLDEGTIVFPNKVNDEPERVFAAVRALDAYSRGERKYFPDKQFRDAFEFFAFANDWDDNHGNEFSKENMCGLACLMEFAAYHAPDINFLTDFVSEDHNVGVFRYPGATLRNFNLYVTYKENGVFRVKTLNTDTWGSPCGYEGYNELSHVRKIGPADARMYLFSNEYPYAFSHCLCWYDEYGRANFFVPENFSECEREWITDDLRYDELEVIYNPERVCWNLCKRVGNTYQPVDGSKTLYLIVDGMSSRYYVE